MINFSMKSGRFSLAFFAVFVLISCSNQVTIPSSDLTIPSAYVMLTYGQQAVEGSTGASDTTLKAKVGQQWQALGSATDPGGISHVVMHVEGAEFTDGTTQAVVRGDSNNPVDYFLVKAGIKPLKAGQKVKVWTVGTDYHNNSASSPIFTLGVSAPIGSQNCELERKSNTHVDIVEVRGNTRRVIGQVRLPTHSTANYEAGVVKMTPDKKRGIVQILETSHIGGKVVLGQREYIKVYNLEQCRPCGMESYLLSSQSKGSLGQIALSNARAILNYTVGHGQTQVHLPEQHGLSNIDLLQCRRFSKDITYPYQKDNQHHIVSPNKTVFYLNALKTRAAVIVGHKSKQLLNTPKMDFYASLIDLAQGVQVGWKPIGQFTSISQVSVSNNLLKTTGITAPGVSKPGTDIPLL